MNELASILNAIMRRLADVERRLAQITTPFSGAVGNLFGSGTPGRAARWVGQHNLDDVSGTGFVYQGGTDVTARTLQPSDIPDLSSTYMTPSAHDAVGNNPPHHAPVTLAAGQSFLTLNGQQLSTAFTLSGQTGATYTLPALTSAALAAGAGTLSASTVNDATISAHTHAVSASSNPGAAEALLKTDAGGLLTLRGLGIGDGYPTYKSLVIRDNNTSTANSILLNIYNARNSVSSETAYIYAAQYSANNACASGTTNSGSALAFFAQAGVPSTTAHAGTLTNVFGNIAYAGLFGTSHTGVVTNVYVMQSALYHQSGTITNAYCLQILDTGSGAVTNGWAIYSQTTFSSYIAGDLRIGASASYNAKLHVYDTTIDKIRAVLRAASGQTADILQVQNSSGTAQASISASGIVRGASFAIQGGASGTSGTFTTADGKTVTVSGGIITAIV